MKQYRFTSSDFAPQEPAIDDAVMDQADLNNLRRLAGLPMLEDKHATSSNRNPSGSMSPVGSNISVTAAEKRAIEHEKNIKPGTPEWFQLWFSRPYLTGEKPVDGESTGPTNSLMSVNVDSPNR